MWEHTMSCEYPEGCSCGASRNNALERRARLAEQVADRLAKEVVERPKVNLELSELYTVAVAHGYANPIEMIDSLLKQKKAGEANIQYILKDDRDVIHACEGGGPEDLNMSLALTMLKTRTKRDALQLYFDDNERSKKQ